MFDKTLFRWVFAVAVMLLTAKAGAVIIDVVPVGNLGNTNDTHGDGYGAVDYAYNIGTYEVTAGQYTEFLNAVGGVDANELYNEDTWFLVTGSMIERYAGSGTALDPYQYQVAADYADRPVGFLSWGDSARFVNWLHNNQPTGAQDLSTTEDGAYFLNGETTGAGLMTITREADWKWAIPSENEWYKAAYHKNDGNTGNYFDYPTSSDSAPGFVDNGGLLNTTGDPFVEGGVDPGNYANYDGDGGLDGIGFPYWRTEVGEWENSASPYGAFDMGGNNWEWNEAVDFDYSGNRGLLSGAYTPGATHMAAGFRGGYCRPADCVAPNMGLRVVNAVAELFPGDFDGDGDVDGDDFLVWQTGFGTIYDGDDFLIWQQNFPTPGSGTGSGGVPEPASIALALLMAAAGTIFRRSRFDRRMR